ncbi:MAG TPA: PIN domain-containing protein [Bryobacteraceae bacterium]|nr:PIN domain-containing protein [Bryobacteraceae bacterium]
MAKLHRNDQYNREAVRLWPTLNPPVLTSNLVVAELAKLLAQRLGYRFAADRVADLYASPTIDILASTREDEIEALAWMRRFADQQTSFIDCVSFAIMRRHKIRTAFTFDRHFRLPGFHVIGLK